MSGALDNSPAEIVRQLLVDLGQGADPGSTWPVFHGTEPTDPDAVVTIFSSGIIHQGRDMNDGEVKDRHNVVVRVRAGSSSTAYAKASDIGQALDKSVRLTTVTVGSNKYLIHAASRKNGPLALGAEPESRGRFVMTLNYSLSMKQTV